MLNRCAAGLFFCVLTIFPLLSSVSLSAASYSWNGPQEAVGNWNTSSLWSPNGVPGVNDTVLIGQRNVKVVIDSDQRFGPSVTVGSTNNWSASLEMTGGNVTFDGGTNSQFIVGGAASAYGTFTMSGGTLTTGVYTIANATNSTSSPGTSTATYSGNAVHTTNQLMMTNNGNAYTNGALYLGGNATVRVTESAVLGAQADGGTATVNQTSGLFLVKPFSTDDTTIAHTSGPTLAKYGLFIGREKGQASYTISGGTLRSYYDVTLGDSDGSVATGDASVVSTLSIKGGSVEILKGVAGMNYPSGAVQGGNLNIGYYGDAPTQSVRAKYGKNVLNIYDGSLRVEGEMIFRGMENYVTVYGSKATEISMAGLRPGYSKATGSADCFLLKYVLDKKGVTPLTINGTFDLDTTEWNWMTLEMPHLLALQTPVIDLFSAQEFKRAASGTVFNNMTSFVMDPTSRAGANGSTIYSLQIRDMYPTWNLDAGETWFVPNNSAIDFGDHTVVGAVKAHGSQAYAIEMGFSVTLGDKSTYELLPALLANLQAAAGVDAGLQLSIYSANSLLLTGYDLNDEGYVWLGWTLANYNNCDDRMRLDWLRPLGGLLGETSVPEPATWGMLFSGIAGVFMTRRFARRAAK